MLHSHVCVCVLVTFTDMLSCEMAGGEGGSWKGKPLNASIELLGVRQLAHTELAAALYKTGGNENLLQTN